MLLALAIPSLAQFVFPPASGNGNVSALSGLGAAGGEVQINCTGVNKGKLCPSGNLIENADGTDTATKGLTWAAPSTPAFGATTTCDFSASNACAFTITSSFTLAVSHPHGSGPYLIKMTHDATAFVYTVTYPASFLIAPQPTQGASEETDLLCSYDGTANYICTDVGGTAPWRGFALTETAFIPGGIAGVDFIYTDSTTHKLKVNLNNGGAANLVPDPFTYTAVTFSATPTFTFGFGANTFKITLTGNVTSSTVASNAAGQPATWVICQDGTGGRTFAWPANFFGAMTIGSTLSKCNTQSFTSDGTNFYATSTGVINQ